MGVIPMKVKKTTLLIIAAFLLWGVVAIWNGIQREDSKNSSTPVTAIHSNDGKSTDQQTVIRPSQRVNIGTH
jgi:starvation-inducible outer membrane lipoprotein